MQKIITIDARGLRCPLPVLKAEKLLDTLAPGEQFVLLADDPIAAIDIPVMCKRMGLIYAADTKDDVARFTITK